MTDFDELYNQYFKPANKKSSKKLEKESRRKGAYEKGHYADGALTYQAFRRD